MHHPLRHPPLRDQEALVLLEQLGQLAPSAAPAVLSDLVVALLELVDLPSVPQNLLHSAQVEHLARHLAHSEAARSVVALSGRRRLKRQQQLVREDLVLSLVARRQVQRRVLLAAQRSARVQLLLLQVLSVHQLSVDLHSATLQNLLLRHQDSVNPRSDNLPVHQLSVPQHLELQPSQPQLLLSVRQHSVDQLSAVVEHRPLAHRLQARSGRQHLQPAASGRSQVLRQARPRSEQVVRQLLPRLPLSVVVGPPHLLSEVEVPLRLSAAAGPRRHLAREELRLQPQLSGILVALLQRSVPRAQRAGSAPLQRSRRLPPHSEHHRLLPRPIQLSAHLKAGLALLRPVALRQHSDKALSDQAAAEALLGHLRRRHKRSQPEIRTLNWSLRANGVRRRWLYGTRRSSRC